MFIVVSTIFFLLLFVGQSKTANSCSDFQTNSSQDFNGWSYGFVVAAPALPFTRFQYLNTSQTGENQFYYPDVTTKSPFLNGTVANFGDCIIFLCACSFVLARLCLSLVLIMSLSNVNDYY
jgi:hypothetical protein